MDRELFDAGEIVGGLVPPGSVFAFLAEHRRELFDDGFIADLFPSRTGRPSLPADLVGSVLVLKELYDLVGLENWVKPADLRFGTCSPPAWPTRWRP